MGINANECRVAARPHQQAQRRCQPFRDAEEAWLWTMAALTARRAGARYTANQGRVMRPCEPDDVVKCLDGLYRRRRIDLVHARIMRIWASGRRRPILPSPTSGATGGCGVRRWSAWTAPSTGGPPGRIHKSPRGHTTQLAAGGVGVKKRVGVDWSPTPTRDSVKGPPGVTAYS